MIVKHFKKLSFTVKAAILNEALVEYFIYDVIGYENGGYPLYEEDFNPRPPRAEFTNDLSKARLYLQGTVKWDGCSDWYFNELNTCWLHGCSRADVLRYGQIMAACWDMTAEILPRFEGNAK